MYTSFTIPQFCKVKSPSPTLSSTVSFEISVRPSNVTPVLLTVNDAFFIAPFLIVSGFSIV